MWVIWIIGDVGIADNAEGMNYFQYGWRNLEHRLLQTVANSYGKLLRVWESRNS